MEWLAPVGIMIGIVSLIFFSYKGLNIIIAAPIAAAIIILSNGMGFKASLLGAQKSYMAGLGGFVFSYFIIFALGAILGKYLEDSKATYTIANRILAITGTSNAFAVMIALALVGAILSYGGISVFIVVFTLSPLARPLFEKLNIPWHLFIAALFSGVGTFTMTMLPGTPAIQNVIPTQLGTTLTAAPLMGIVCSVVTITISVVYMKRQLILAGKKGETFGMADEETAWDIGENVLPPLGASLTPIILLISIILAGSAMEIPDIIIPALLAAIMSAAVCLKNYLPHNQLTTLNAGVLNSIAPIFFTAATVGVGSVATAAPGFTLILNAVSGLPGGTIMQAVTITGLLSVITASPSGALGIVIPAFGHAWVANGMAPEVIHRVCSIAAGAFGAMPHCGVIFAVMAVTGLKHKEVYKHFFVVGFVGGIVALMAALLMSGFY